uniref:Uncharacterized protein n=1 Tax=Meloidogyne javanica TaxID=6303 RepID=A0A915N5N9_MELJA
MDSSSDVSEVSTAYSVTEEQRTAEEEEEARQLQQETMELRKKFKETRLEFKEQRKIKRERAEAKNAVKKELKQKIKEFSSLKARVVHQLDGAIRSLFDELESLRRPRTQRREE